MADGIRATPRQNPILGLLADRLKQAQQFGAKPFGYENPPAEMLMNLLGVPAVQQTLERMSYGEPLTTGRGMTTQVRPEAVEAAMTLLPMAAGAAKVTKGLPVGASIKNVSKIDEATGLPLNSDGTVTLFHHTNKAAAEQIQKTGKLKSSGEPSVYLTTQKTADTGYGDVVVPIRVKPSLLNLDDEFPNGRMDFSIDTGKPKGSVPVTVEKQSFEYPQEEAIRLAQQRAALPVEQGGLGLPADNTPEMRAAAMSFDLPAYHTSRTGIDTNILDSGKYAMAPFDSIGTHFGTKEAALDRFNRTVGTTDQVKGSSYPVLLRSDRPYYDVSGNIYTEDPLAMILSAKSDYGNLPKSNANLRNEIFADNSIIPYINDVEAAGSVSYIAPPENIRSRFAAFDPFRKTAATAALMGVSAPDLLAQEVDYTLLPPKKQEELLRSLLGQ